MTSRALSFLARRFVAGETAAEAVAAAREMNARGMDAILDFLGEDVHSEAEAGSAVQEYLRLLDLIKAHQVRSAISLKVSQMGLRFSLSLCESNLALVLERAAQYGNFVWLDMEGSALTQSTIEVFEALRSRFANIGLCLQAYLVRTGSDLDRLMRKPAILRLCKGAYKEPPDIAFKSKGAVEANYRVLTQKLFDHVEQGIFPAFATHDVSVIEYVLQQVKEKRIDAKQFEFQMLYGIQNKKLQSLSKQGYQTRVYIPYGTAWLPYFLRRLRERKENVYFLMRNVFRM
jgi:proline dehydrogenase